VLDNQSTYGFVKIQRRGPLREDGKHAVRRYISGSDVKYINIFTGPPMAPWAGMEISTTLFGGNG
jgi:hypothetical protein